MAKVHPYLTDFEEHPAEHRNVYHDRDDARTVHTIVSPALEVSPAVRCAQN